MSTMKLEQIQAGLKALDTVNCHYEEHTVMGILVGLVPVSKTQAAQANLYAHTTWELAKQTTNRFILGDWYGATKVGMLSFAIRKLNDMDFRGVQHINCGKDLNRPVHIVLRELIETWDSSFVDALFDLFEDLTTRVEQKVRKDLVLSAQTPQEELEELDKRREELLEKLGEEDSPDVIEDTPQESQVDPEAVKDMMFGTQEKTPSEPPKADEEPSLYQPR